MCISFIVMDSISQWCFAYASNRIELLYHICIAIGDVQNIRPIEKEIKQTRNQTNWSKTKRKSRRHLFALHRHDRNSHCTIISCSIKMGMKKNNTRCFPSSNLNVSVVFAFAIHILSMPIWFGRHISVRNNYKQLWCLASYDAHISYAMVRCNRLPTNHINICKVHVCRFLHTIKCNLILYDCQFGNWLILLCFFLLIGTSQINLVPFQDAQLVDFQASLTLLVLNGLLSFDLIWYCKFNTVEQMTNHWNEYENFPTYK